MQITVSVPGKLILSGEHAVVYGAPALVCAVNKRLRLTLDGEFQQLKNLLKTKQERQQFFSQSSEQFLQVLSSSFNISHTISSEIPMGCGMGSSAALSVAIVVAVFRGAGVFASKKTINSYAYLMEKNHHGNPSGVDNTICAYGGFLWYRKETDTIKTYTQLHSKVKLPTLYIVQTGKPKETTKEMVALVAKYAKLHNEQFKKNLADIELLTKRFARFLLGESSDNFYDIVRENHQVLCALGVVSECAKHCISAIEQCGGAAKISGAGGKEKDSGIILAMHPQKEVLYTEVHRLGFTIEEIQYANKGVLYE